MNMKNAAVAILAIWVTATTYGQGTINFANRLSGVFDSPITIINGLSVNEGVGNLAGTKAQLLLVIGTSLTPVGTPISFRGSSDPLARYFDGGSVEIPGTTAGGTVTLKLRISGPSVSQTDSASWSQQLGGGQLPPENMVNMKGFGVIYVPEPTTIALGLFGAAVLFCSRRKL
jgi:hypothetical protein